MKKIIYNIDNFIITCFKKITKMVEKNTFFSMILGLLLMIVNLIVFGIPVIILSVIYNLFIDREQLIKEYKKVVKK